MTAQRAAEAASRDRAMVDHLAAQSAGITTAQAAEAIHCTQKAARLSLYRLMYRGQAVYVAKVGDGFGHWSRPELKPVLLAAKAAYREEIRRRVKAHDNRARVKPDPTEEVVDPPIVHRLVRACEAPPLHTRGVPSVFHLWERA